MPRFEIKNGKLIKGGGWRTKSTYYDLEPLIKKYLKMSVKEIFIEDIVASLFKKLIFKLLKI